MGKKILISINPEYVDLILKGEKKYEYRTKRAKEDVTSLVIYETSPVKQVVAEVEIIKVIELPINELWEETHKYGGINKGTFDEYFTDKEIGYAYELGKVKQYKRPKSVEDIGIKRAPQSYCYI